MFIQVHKNLFLCQMDLLMLYNVEVGQLVVTKLLAYVSVYYKQLCRQTEDQQRIT